MGGVRGSGRFKLTNQDTGQTIEDLSDMTLEADGKKISCEVDPLVYQETGKKIARCKIVDSLPSQPVQEQPLDQGQQ
jgi:predicted phage-related endonuclease